MSKDESKINSDFITDKDYLENVINNVTKKANIKLQQDKILMCDDVVKMFYDEVGFKIEEQPFRIET